MFQCLTNDLGLADGRMGVQELLNFSWVNVLPSSDDHVLHSANNLAIAILINDGNISGVEPSVRRDHLQLKIYVEAKSRIF